MEDKLCVFERRLRMLSYITQFKYTTRMELAEEFNVSLATINRDMSYLRTFENITEAPFPYIQEIAIAEYKILDSNNKEIIKTKLSAEDGDKGTVSNGKVLVNLSLNDSKFKSGEEYTIAIEKMYGLSKADAPLHISFLYDLI